LPAQPSPAATPAAPVPAAATAARPRLDAEEAARLRERVAIAFERLREQDPFDLLDAANARTLDEIRSRYFAFARQFAPWQFEEMELRSAAPAAEELFAAGALAFARLCNAKERESLRAARQDRGKSVADPGRPAQQAPPPASAAPAPLPPSSSALAPPLSAPGATHRTAGPAPASFRIETDLLDPEVQFKKGRALKEARRWSQALQQFEFAADCDAQNGAYRAEAAHCRFLLAPSSMAAKTLEELKEAQRIDPEAVTPYLYAGEIAAHLGRFDEAETYLRAAAKRLGPADRRALDALRDLAKKRKK
jgi:curved DNA-binding protein CbpA